MECWCLHWCFRVKISIVSGCIQGYDVVTGNCSEWGYNINVSALVIADSCGVL